MKEVLTAIAGASCVVLVIVVCVADPHKEANDRGLRTAEIQGQMAYEAGVEASANPYQGTRNYSDESFTWLDGWMAAKKEAGE